MNLNHPLSTFINTKLIKATHVAILISAASAVIFIHGCGKPAEKGATPEGRILKPVSMTTVATAVAKKGSISKQVDVTGSLVALQDVVVGAKQAGKIGSVLLHEGDSVSAGQVVAMMDTTELTAQMMSAQANVNAALTREQQAAATLQQARNSLSNSKTNLDWTDRTSLSSLNSAKSGLQSARENLTVVKSGARTQERDQAKEQVKSAKANFDKARADLNRYQALFVEQAVSKSQLDQAQATSDAAQATYNSAILSVSLIQEGARPEDIRRAELAVQQAQDVVNKSTADREMLKMRMEDVKSAQTGILSAIAGVNASKAATEQARATLHIAQDALANASIKSPISGYVAERRAEPGQQVGSGNAVMRIVDPSTVYFQAVMSESQFSDVQIGQPAAVSVDAVPTAKFSGTVTRVLPVASASSRSFNVRIDITGDKRLRPQMFARGAILIETHTDALLVPKDSVIFDSDSAKNRIFTIDPSGKAVERIVKVGFTTPESVEILNGVIGPGDKVIISGQSALQNGDMVKVQQAS